MIENDTSAAPQPGLDDEADEDTSVEDARIKEAIVQTHFQSLGYVLSRAHFQFRQRMIQALDGTGLHMGQVVILASLRAQRLLRGESDLTQTRLTQITGIEKSSLVLFLDALEKDGWVERRRHLTDRRAYIVHLTESGAERFDPVGQRLQQNEDECLSVFSDAERQQMSGLLLRLLHHMQTLD